MKDVVKYDVYLDILRVLTIYVKKYRFFLKNNIFQRLTVRWPVRLLLQQRAAVPNFDVDALFAASRALRGIAADLQGALTEVESLQFASASLIASLTHGPLKAPSASSVCSGFSAEDVFGLSAAAAAPPPLELPDFSGG